MRRLAACCLGLIVWGCGGGGGNPADAEAAEETPATDAAGQPSADDPGLQVPEEPIFALKLNSPAFPDGSSIPKRHTCDGEDQSPELAWPELPGNAVSLALVCSDPDAPMGTWDHWVLWNIAPETRSLPEGVPSDTELGRPGVNGWKELGYRGPCPPHGTPHRYVFLLYVLDTTLDLEGQVTREALEAAVEGHVLALGTLTGTYQRGSGK